VYLPAQLAAGVLVALLAIGGVALAPLQALLSVVAQNDVPAARVGSITSAVLLARQIGSSGGLALLNGLYSYGLTQGSGSLSEGLRWAFSGMAVLSAGLITMTLLLPDVPLRQKRLEEETPA
jgi:hypothetical protein